MNFRQDLRIVGLLAGLIGLFMLFPLIVGVAHGEPVGHFTWSILAALVVALLGVLAGRGAGTDLQARDGFLVVTLGWVTASLISGMPYLFSGRFTLADAWFEAVSGITTTGSTILTDIEALPHSLLLWRSLTQWLGGMGIILFTIAVLPLLGVGGMQLFKAEVPGPVADKVAPRLAVTARYLWFIYVGLTSLEALLLLFGGMPWLEAIDHSLTTLATGGFSPRNASIGAYDSAYLRGVIMFFMLCAGTNFVLHFRLLRGRWRDVARDGELRWFLSLLLLFAAPIALVLIGAGQTLGSSVEDALFTVISLVTTTGYGTVDFEQWPIVLHGVLIPLLIFGGMAGSTGGGVKTLRTLIAFRAIRMSFRQMLHPHALTPVTYRGQRVPFDVLDGIWGFFAVYFLIALIGMLVINVAGADLVTAWSASLTAIGNVGPGLGDVGPSDNFGWLPGYAKWALTALMLCGRLEVYTVVLLLLPGFWRR